MGPPPDQRPNWPRLNEGQRRYAWEQYNRALVNRGLAIDHPHPAQEEAAPDSPDPEPIVGDLPELVDLDSELGSPMSGHHRSIASHTSSADSTSNQAGPSAKKARTETEAAAVEGDVEMPDSSSLPGTGMDQGANGSSLGGGTGSVMPYVIPHAAQMQSHVTRKFTKAWKMLTHGWANNVITKAVTTPASNNYFLTTALARVPVENVWFYMSPQEFATLKAGEKVVEVKCRIYQRNVRVAFPTATSESNLATLNQNKNTQVAIGLNLTGYGADFGLTPADSAPMVPTDVILASDADMATAYTALLYGVANSDTEFAQAHPRNATGFFFPASQYWCAATNSLNTGGWPSIKEHWKEIDSSDAIGKKLVDYTYKPLEGHLRASPTWRDIGFPRKASAIATTHGAGRSSGGEVLTMNTVQSAPNLVVTDTTVVKAGSPNYATRIEKSQNSSTGYYGSRGTKIQPSVHVGVQAVPALSADETLGFVDVQAYFDIEVEMITTYAETVDRQLPSAAGTLTLDEPLSKQFVEYGAAAQFPNYTKSTFMGNYASGAASVNT